MKYKSKLPAYKRLYNEAEVKRNNKNLDIQQQIQTPPPKKKINQSNSAKNVGHQMYEKAMIRIERMKFFIKLIDCKKIIERMRN